MKGPSGYIVLWNSEIAVVVPMPPAEMMRSLGRLLHTTSFGPFVRERDSGAGTRAASATEVAPTAEEAHAATSIALSARSPAT